MNLNQRQELTSLLIAGLVFLAGAAAPTTAYAELDVSQLPLYVSAGQDIPPINMLVMGKDHKSYYEAYNDASDLNGDGEIDVGYKPEEVDYYGYFNSNACYVWNASKNRFDPAGVAGGSRSKQCSTAGHWSGDFLNYLTTGRLDALRKVLYGGWRQVDSITETVLQGAYFPQDAHSWGKEYQSIERDGYDIRKYSPLRLPEAGRQHLFAVTTLADNTAPLFRVLQNSPYRVWNWVSIEGPVADNTCFTGSGSNTSCVGGGGDWNLVPPSVFQNLTITTWRHSVGNPTTRTAMDTMFTGHAIPANLCGSGAVVQINAEGSGNNPFAGANSCGHDNYMTRIQGDIVIPSDGTYRFGIDGDDAVDLFIDGTLVVGWYGGHGNDRSDAGLSSHSGSIYLTAGNHTVLFRHQEGGGGDNWGLFWESDIGATARQDYAVRVLACPSTPAWREANCKAYGSGGSATYKPTGILHDFGESNRMYFGLMTGSQMNNLEGGVLRRNLASFSDEINLNTGQFRTNVDGIARTLDSFRMIGGDYGGKTRSRDESGNWNWNGGTGYCPAFGDRALKNGECRMWGNPIGEMMFETLRYYAGAEAAYPNYVATTGSGGIAAGKGEEATLGLTTEAWKDPYKPEDEGGLGFLHCSKPVMTVISDINPSYDSNIPGNPWDSATFDLPSSISDFDMGALGQRMWNSEFGGGSRSVFIGELAAGFSDGAPTAKTASSFGSIRGLSPEEPTKQGSYASSAVSFYAWTKNGGVNALSDQNVRTYSVALASPLPRIEFPVGGGNSVVLVPFAKTASGTFGMGNRKPTNTIVDFYVEEYNNFPGQVPDSAINGGLPKAIFRINYEDVEQGNDHDMDAIVRYEIAANVDGTVTVKLTSEYAAGSANQVMGYVISGTTKDGVYLEVRDVDSPTCRRISSSDCNGGYIPYALNTPPNRDPGYCEGNTSDECGLLPTVATRVFTPDSGAGGTTTLRDPLWYAAKYGGFNDLDGNGLPNAPEEWRGDDGNPENYFLVTNALSLKEALEKAFNKILADARSSGGTAASGSRHNEGFLAYVPEYDTRDWTGDIRAHKVNRTTGALIEPRVWSVKAKLAAIDPVDRDIKFVKKTDPADPDDIGSLKDFASSELGSTPDARAQALGYSNAAASGDLDEVVAYLRGDHSLEDPGDGSGRFRKRGSRLGDILGSQPTILSTGSYGYSLLPADEGGGYDGDGLIVPGGYVDFVKGKKERVPVAFVGANDGMLHAINASNDADGGKEIFSIIPNSVLTNLHELTSPAYSHRYYVDGSPEQGDAYFDGEWHTVILVPMGAGGRSVMAIDATDPAADGAQLLWEFTHPDLGLTIGRPRIARWGGRWVAIFGNGYNSDNNKAFLFIVDLKNGELLERIKLGDQGTGAIPNGLATTFPVDLDRDADADLVYAGDYYGNLWRVNLKDYGGGDAGDAVKLYSGDVDTSGTPLHPITGGVNVTYHHARGQMVFFGTGKYFLEGDNAKGQPGDPVHSFFGVWDDPLAGGSAYPLEKDDLRQQSFVTEPGGRSVTGQAVDWSTEYGWYINLPDSGERFVGIPEVSLGRVIFTSFVAEGDQCSPGGRNWLNVLSATSGVGMIGTGGAGGGGGTGDLGAIALPADGGGGPAPTPPIVSIGEEPDCDPLDPNCEPPKDPEECEDGDPDCDPNAIQDLRARGCETRLGVLTHLGIIDFDSFGCGRQSWKQYE